jgi:hypothetical protein
MLSKVKSFLPPTIVETHSGRWMVANGEWLAIPKNVTLDMVRVAWVKDIPVKKTYINNKWKVKGSKGDTYTVSITNNQWNCTCSGFGFRRKCKHVDEIKLKHK